MQNTTYNFFMSAVTSNGFNSYFPELTDEEKYKTVYLIKGGAGSGKSTLIKKAAEKMDGKNKNAELIFCSADPQSLDAAILCDKTIIDATAPHIIEPTLSGAFENVVSLYSCFDNSRLMENREKMKEAAEEEIINISRAESFIRAAGMLLLSNESVAARCINTDKLSGFIARFCMREIKKNNGKVGEIKNRYLSTLCDKGVFIFTDTAKKLCSRFYIIEDESGAVSGIILDEILRKAVSMGYCVYRCTCPISKSRRTEHIFIPELSLGIMTSNKFHPIFIEGAKVVRASRFLIKEKIRNYSHRTSFQQKAARSLLLEASVFLKKRLEAHKKLEEFYALACDNDMRNKLFEKTLKEL